MTFTGVCAPNFERCIYVYLTQLVEANGGVTICNNDVAPLACHLYLVLCFAHDGLGADVASFFTNLDTPLVLAIQN